MRTSRLIPLLLLALYSLYALWSAPLVPFHPDESTYLYMSADFATLLRAPAELFWQPEKQTDRRQKYRLLDAPLTKTLLGAGLMLTRQTAPPVDWDWGKTWQQNTHSGALPNPTTLAVARIIVTLLLPISISLLYLSGYAHGGVASAWGAALLLAINGFTLLHARRAMSEGALFFGVTLFLYLLSRSKTHPLLLGIAAALAFNAKQSAVGLLPIGLLAVLWDAAPLTGSRKPQWRAALLYVSVFAIITAALNPVYWRAPFATLPDALRVRAELSAAQTADALRLNPESVLDTPAKRLLALIANLYLLPPAPAEVGNYLSDTAPAEARYFALPFSNSLRGLFAGALLFTLTLTGLGMMLLRLRHADLAERRAIILFLLAFGMQTTLVLGAFALPWQRYVTPVLPFVLLLAAYPLRGIAALGAHLKLQFNRS
ncbi:MAG: hypothetical protein OHK0052_11380 [Anaerolineales bacterium]